MTTQRAYKRVKLSQLIIGAVVPVVAGPYRAEDRPRVLAERLEGLISQEHVTWTESRQHEKRASPARTKRI